MALLIDTDLITVRDLLSYENDLLETADRERVEVETKIALGIEEIRTETEAEVDKILRSGSSSAGALASICNVVATPALLRWALYRCLALFYFQCFGNQTNERFRRKFEHYRTEAEIARRDYLQRGIGVVDLPLSRPAALSAKEIPGSLPAGAYYFAAAWVNARGQESALGITRAATLTATGGLRLTSVMQANATGWNVYLGDSPETLYRQNEGTLQPGAPWLQDSTILTATSYGGAQSPDRYLQPQRIFPRG